MLALTCYGGGLVGVSVPTRFFIRNFCLTVWLIFFKGRMQSFCFNYNLYLKFFLREGLRIIKLGFW